VKIQLKIIVTAFAVLAAIAPATPRAQQAQSDPPAANSSQDAGSGDQNSAPPAARTGPAGPCWRQAGITRAELQQRQAIQEKTRSQIAGVCTDTSLTPKEKAQQVRQIRLAELQQFSDWLTPEQQKALKECQRARRDAIRSGDADSSEAPAPHPGANSCAQQ
jgi:hypothetical protein